ncbi:DUF6250 domain-containing protein [Uliginosibacterium gangwonense]|uniref:DUF6250 domain-containing protein n=1 Tax=Uliginosibacterium gangwonense TaxID=392736 RepID=UPI00037357B5|nr:DUF6250 domain-containing protein [Uliginosibacterium gangwonense]
MRQYPSQARADLVGIFVSVFMLMGLSACGGGDSVPESSSVSSPTSVVLASDDFTKDLSLWKVEQENASGTVSVTNGVLDIVQPAGATLWFKQKLSGDYEIRFTATPIPYTVTVGTKTYTDRISDLNMFWNATVPTGSDPDPTHLNLDGKLASYNPLALYYVGFGANGNTTTRLRRYDGTALRPQITGYATAASRTDDDKAGAMTPATSLTANTPVSVRVVSRVATAGDKATLKWYANDVLIFSYEDAAPFLSGWFGFRTTVSHWQLSHFSVVRL